MYIVFSELPGKDSPSGEVSATAWVSLVSCELSVVERGLDM
jgi:hypothetical protein